MRILLITQGVECVTFTLAFALSECGYSVSLGLLPEALARDANKYYLKQCEPFITGVSKISKKTNEAFSHVVVEVGYTPPPAGLLDGITAVGKSLTVVAPTFSGPPFRRMKMSLGHLMKFWPLYKRRPNIVSHENPCRIDFLTLFCRRRNIIGLEVHHTFLTDPDLKLMMFSTDWEISKSRPSKLNFVGADKPESRSQILSEIEGLLESYGLDCLPNSDAKCPWFKVGTNHDALNERSYIHVLSQSDFTLCPPGYSVWTHRVVEAMLQGSIPILEDEVVKSSGLPLKHGTNCFLVRNNDWKSVVNYSLHLSEAKVMEMRSELKKLCGESGFLGASASPLRIVARLGVPCVIQG